MERVLYREVLYRRFHCNNNIVSLLSCFVYCSTATPVSYYIPRMAITRNLQTNDNIVSLLSCFGFFSTASPVSYYIPNRVFCGTDGPVTGSESSNVLYVRFSTDINTQRSGFSMTVKLGKCNQILGKPQLSAASVALNFSQY